MSANLKKGIACIVVSAFGFSLMAFMVRLCDDFGGTISCFQKGFFRNFVALIIAGFVFCRARRIRSSRSRDRSAPILVRLTGAGGQALAILVLRCLFGTFGIFANFYALSHVPIGEAMTLNKTAPFFTVLFSWILLGERASIRQISCLAVAFAGALLVIRPGFRGVDGPDFLWALSGGLAAGLAYVCVHRLGRMGVDGSLIVLAFSAFSCLASVPFVGMDFHPMTMSQLVILFGSGIGAAVGQFGITAAYRFAEPRSIAAFDYVGVVFAALFGLFFFGQIPDMVSVAGFAMILFGAFFLRR